MAQTPPRFINAACAVIFFSSTTATVAAADSQELVKSLVATAQSGQAVFPMTGNIDLPAHSVIHANLVFEGSAASGATLDCHGSTIAAEGKTFDKRIAITVRSKELPDGTWDAPHDVTIKNCVIDGNIRLYGLNISANGDAMRESSGHANHTAYAQASAPRRVSLLHMQVSAKTGVPLYIGPGVTETTVADSTVEGKGDATGIYLDAESARNTIKDNRLSYQSTKRESLAIDGSAHNVIIGNTFTNSPLGGIFIYRNCGEGGVIRHLKPEYNMIERNTFIYPENVHTKQRPAIWIGSREGRQPFCFSDPARPFGSSLSPLDFAQHNSVKGNVFVDWPDPALVNRDKDNTVVDNVSH